MKVIAVFFAVISLVLMVACGSDEGGDFTTNDQQPSATAEPADVNIDPGYHDAIDFSPAATLAEREQGYFQVAAWLADPFTTKPNQDLVFDLVWEELEPVAGNAGIHIVGMFEENGEWVEKEADFRITRTAVENWILKDEVQFEKTADQFGRERDEQKIVEYTEALAVFDAITVSVVSAEVTADQWFETKNFVIQIDNPTNQDHEVDYLLQWTVTSEDSRCGNPEDEKRGRENAAASSTVLVEVESVTNLFGSFRYCGNPSLEKTRVAVVRVDGYVREKVEQRLADLQSQTSPP